MSEGFDERMYVPPEIAEQELRGSYDSSSAPNHKGGPTAKKSGEGYYQEENNYETQRPQRESLRIVTNAKEAKREAQIFSGEDIYFFQPTDPERVKRIRSGEKFRDRDGKIKEIVNLVDDSIGGVVGYSSADFIPPKRLN